MAFRGFLSKGAEICKELGDMNPSPKKNMKAKFQHQTLGFNMVYPLVMSK
jgi:hypothetical protein